MKGSGKNQNISDLLHENDRNNSCLSVRYKHNRTDFPVWSNEVNEIRNWQCKQNWLVGDTCPYYNRGRLNSNEKDPVIPFTQHQWCSLTLFSMFGIIPCRMWGIKLTVFLKSARGRWLWDTTRHLSRRRNHLHTRKHRLSVPLFRPEAVNIFCLYGSLFCFAYYLQEHRALFSNTWGTSDFWGSPVTLQRS